MKSTIYFLPLFVILTSAQLYAQSVPDKAIDVSPLLIGESVPHVVLRDANGKADSLQMIISRKPAVVIFYRGGWCPYCNLHLAELQSIESEILALGYQIVAVSPDSPENMKASIEKHKLKYKLYSDAAMSVAQAFGIAYAVPEAVKERLANSSGGNNPGQLPVPSVFVLNQQGEILFEYINPDYKKRIKANILLAVLKELNQK